MTSPTIVEKAGTALAISGVSKVFNKGNTNEVTALSDVNLDVDTGEFISLIGPSGCGKSTVARAALQLLPPGSCCEGDLLLNGQDPRQLSRPALRALRGEAVGLVFQDPMTRLNPLMTVGGHLLDTFAAHRPAMGYQERKDRAESLLEQVGIGAERFRAYPHEFSGGMRQRLAIALAIALAPPLVIADEPTTALDVTVQAQILSVLSDLRRARGLAIIFITHDFGVVGQLCDRVAVMYAGRIVEEGPTDAVLRRPQHPYTSRLIACVPTLGAGQRKLAAIPGLPPVVDRLPVGCAFADRCDKAQAECRAGPVDLVTTKDGRKVRCLFPETAMERRP